MREFAVPFQVILSKIFREINFTKFKNKIHFSFGNFTFFIICILDVQLFFFITICDCFNLFYIFIYPGSNTVKAAIRPCLEDYSMSSSDWSVCSSTPFKYNNSKNNSNMNPQHNNSHLRSSQSNPQLSDLKENKASEEAEEPRPLRPLEECVKIYKVSI